MSKNIVIQEGGVGRQLTTDKLKTNLVGGGTCLWVPEDEVSLGKKTVTQNGTYKAADEGYYGYESVTVRGIGTAAGRGADGETHAYIEDGQGGVTEVILPASIAVETPPTVTEYRDGAEIDFTGMVVKGYLKSGKLWTDDAHPDGVIPIAELLLPVTRADKDAITDSMAVSDLVDTPIPFTNHLVLTQTAEGFGRDYTYINERTEGLFAVIVSQNRTDILNVQGEKDAKYLERTYTIRANGTSQGHNYEAPYWAYTYMDKTVYYSGVGQSWTYDLQSCANAPQLNEKVAWTMLYGEILSGGQHVPVQYVRPDGQALEGTFIITVTGVNYDEDE